MQLTGRIKGISLDYKTMKPELTLKLNQNTDFEEIINEENLDIEIKKHREKRSLDANAYCWVLVGKIADLLRNSKEKVYVSMLFDYGQVILIPTIKGKKPDGYFKYYKFFQEGVLNGKECDWYKVAKGSSEYDTREMSIFIDGIVQEAQSLGIETATPEELALLKEEWK